MRLPGFKTAPQLGRGNELCCIPDLPRLLLAKDEKRKSKDEGQTKIDGRRTKSKNQRRKSADKNCTTGPPYITTHPLWEINYPSGEGGVGMEKTWRK